MCVVSNGPGIRRGRLSLGHTGIRHGGASMQRGRWIVLALALSLGCHHQAAESRGAGSNNIITQEEIDAAGASNVYDVIARLHGNFLNDRGRVSLRSNTHSRAMVFLNDQEY